MPEYYCPDDCELQKECSLKHPLPGDRFTNNSSNTRCWCYLKSLPPLKKSGGVNVEIAKWRDGTDMVCSECGEPIYTTQPVVKTISQVPKKRHCRHFMCSPTASITIIGNGQVTTFKGK